MTPLPDHEAAWVLASCTQAAEQWATGHVEQAEETFHLACFHIGASGCVFVDGES